MALVFRLCDNAPELLRDVCLERGWNEYDEEDEEADWNLWWKSSGFRTSDFEACRPWQRLNHFPKSNAITRKDCLARSLRRMKGVYGKLLYNFAPLSFNLPNDYRKFVTEYSKYRDEKKLLWICKPVDQSRGRGIFLFRNLTNLTYDCATVVQQYVQNPFLIAGYKFDLRLYVLVTSFDPLHIYLYHEGLARFGTEKFDLNCLDNVFSHLTNTSINKQGPYYAMDKERIGSGCKWSLSQLRTYFNQHNIDAQLLWHRITALVILTLLMQAPEVTKNSTNCFELFGFDVLIDENLKPWLLEVNFSPSLGVDCTLDITIKKALLKDTLDAINLEESNISSCTIKNCIQKIGIQKQSCSSRVRSKFKGQKINNVKKSCRFYSRSRNLGTSSALSNRISKSSLENNTSSSSDGLSTIEMSLNPDLDDDNEVATVEESEGNGREEASKELNHLQLHCGDLDNSSKKLFQINASVEFREVFSCTTSPTKATKPTVARNSESSASKEYVDITSLSDMTIDSNPEQENFVHEKYSTVADGYKHKKKHQHTTLPPLDQSPKKTYYPFGRRSAKISPYLPVKQQYIPKKKEFTLLNCSCQHELPGWSSYKRNPSKRIGDYILIFPFNEASQKPSSSNQPSNKAAIDEVKKVLQKIIHLSRNKAKFKSSIEEDIKKLDLTQPFWGFSSFF